MTVADDVEGELVSRKIRVPRNMSAMDEADGAKFVQLRDWWLGIPETTQKLFTALVRSDDTAHRELSQLLVGKPGLLVTDQTPLGDYFEAVVTGLGARGRLPIILVADPVLAIDPAEPAAGQPFVVRWTERNEGGPSRGYQDDFQVSPHRGGAGFHQTITVEALEAGATKDHAIEVQGLAAGTYDVMVLVNDSGTGSGMLGSTSGHGMAVAGQVIVGGLDQNDDPDIARLNRVAMEVSGSLSLLPMSATSVDEATQAAAALVKALRRMAPIAPAAARDGLTAAADRLAAVTFGPSTVLATVATAMQTATDSATSLQLAVQSASIRKQVADAEADLADAATKLTTAADAMAAAG